MEPQSNLSVTYTSRYTQRGAPSGKRTQGVLTLLANVAVAGQHKSCHESMPPSHTVDIKCQFERYDCVPGPKARLFRRNLIQYGGKCDDRGFSLADCLLRIDEGACTTGTGILGIAPVAAPGAPALPVAPAQGGAGGAAARVRLATATAARSRRLKESATFIVMHIDVDAPTDSARARTASRWTRASWISRR